jgi:hypothetical protein
MLGRQDAVGTVGATRGNVGGACRRKYLVVAAAAATAAAAVVLCSTFQLRYLIGRHRQGSGGGCDGVQNRSAVQRQRTNRDSSLTSRSPELGGGATPLLLWMFLATQSGFVSGLSAQSSQVMMA